MGAGMSEGEGAPADKIQIGDFKLDLGRGLLLKGGRPVSTRARCFALLAFLARNANRVVSRDEIFASVWKGVAVTDDALTQTVRDLRNALEDGAQDLIRTVTKRGYMLTLPPPPAATGSATLGKLGDAKANLLTASMARPAFAVPPGEAPLASIAVLPFVNLSDDAEQDYFALGLAEDLIADLSKLRGLTVIARHSSFAFADRAVDPRIVSGRLGVRYLVEGSVSNALISCDVNLRSASSFASAREEATNSSSYEPIVHSPGALKFPV
jgi:TolB-like protein/DNA-binding winged helix-turn-helix (wHTH) protein